jgi:hypothetical protein
MADETYLSLDSYDLTIIKDKLNGALEVDESLRTTRYAICQECNELNKRWHKCQICNCWMPVKARLPGTKCPLEKW